jgi:MFS family permease
VNPLRDTTFFYDRWRSLAAGVLETAGATFLLLIALRHFEAGPFVKSLLVAGGGMGMMVSPFSLAVFSRLGWRSSEAAAFLYRVGAFAFGVAALFPILPVFVAGSIVALIAMYAAIPLLTQIYQEAYRDEERGKLFSRAFIIRIATTVFFSEAGGRFLTDHLARYQWMLLVYATAFAFSAWCVQRCVTGPLSSDTGARVGEGFSLAQKDRVFRDTLVAWMFMGFANLMMLPLRVEYLANPKYGLALPTAWIAMIVGVVPNAARLLMNPIWGRLFDRVNFFALRVVLNFGFLAGVLTFFSGTTMTGLLLGSVIYGISNAGGDVAWSLWVTKIAPPERVAQYMAVHTFLTGVRAVIAPFAGFYALQIMSIQTLGWGCAGMIFISILMLLPEIRLVASRRPGSPVVEEMSE